MKLPLCYSGSMKATKTSILLFFIIIAACIAGTLLLTDDDAAPLLKVGVITACSIVVSFFFSVLTGDYSWTDRLWSTLPVALAWVYAWSAGLNAPSVTASLLIMLWGARLTFNFARRGGYTGEEDYRWAILRERIDNPVLWMIFNLLSSPSTSSCSSSLSPVLCCCLLNLHDLHSPAFICIHTLVCPLSWHRNPCRSTTIHLPAGKVSPAPTT